ncbi:hypothetical protein GCM10010121_018570 [Streptomyces brasiliensis]|uniref:Uncharacterized protein n=1 Tax=Streptomyces brasiliensis TaxID=1954 RepID=A0A917KDM6_9ACTN|nr:hypothetical protein GCM10010121_018570 [Streptomyces brasiliensis]
MADLIEKYHAPGVAHFVLSGHPHLRETCWFGEGVIPELSARWLLEHAASGSGAPSSSRAAAAPSARGRSSLLALLLQA